MRPRRRPGWGPGLESEDSARRPQSGPGGRRPQRDHPAKVPASRGRGLAVSQCTAAEETGEKAARPGPGAVKREDSALPNRSPSGANPGFMRNERVQDSLMAADGEMSALMRSTDWSRTALGPAEAWRT